MTVVDHEEILFAECDVLSPCALGAVFTPEDQRYDLHALIELVEHGCPPLLAVRILAPLDVEGAAA